MPLWMTSAVLLMLLFSRQAMEAALKAADVFCRSVMPALFPMMVLSGLIPTRGTDTKHERRLYLEQIMFGFCAGSPASARQLAINCSRYPVLKKHLEPLCCMSGVMSPLFFTGSLAALIGDRSAWLLLLCHWATALLTGGLCMGWHRIRKLPKTNTEPSSAAPSAKRPSLPDAISSAASALLSVLGAMMLFAILSALVKVLLAGLFPRWTEAHPQLLAVIWALLEIGGGSFALLEASPTPPLWLLCALCSMGGMSIWLQNLLFLGKMLHPVKLLLWRTLHGVLAGLCCYLLMPFAAETAAAASVSLPAGLTQPHWLALALLTALAAYRHPSS